MYNLPQIADEKDEVRQAVLHARAYKPIYVKIKVNYGCNLKCEMCKHWRETREPPISMNRFREIISELAELGCKKIHFSGGEPGLRLMHLTCRKLLPCFYLLTVNQNYFSFFYSFYFLILIN